ncbi:MAG: hypothetical protein IJZ75_03950 [Clostridia bacterium]|nr:hypothetical protein [Clostridia bacterium]
MQNKKINRLDIYKIACKLRTAMNSAYKNGEFDNEVELQRFPKGSCGISSYFLGEYLMEHGITTKYVNRTYYYGETSYESQAHTWLEINPRLIVDITGDQFKNNSILMNYDIPVYVGDYNEFYNLFESTPNGEHKLTKGHILSNEERIIYNKIKEHL